ncbi:MAG: PEGA domain-containing protein [Nannocystaceae bacterium]|nr:PEGA domain-containing protein [Nannocystaceae bacterium]
MSGLVVHGTLGEDWRKLLAEQLATGLARGNFALVQSAPVTCVEAACLRQICSEHGAAYLIVPQVTSDTHDHQVTLEVVDARTGEVVVEASEPCAVCGMHEFGEVVADQAARLRERLDALVVDPPMLAVRGASGEVVVTVDGQGVGITPLLVEVSPGRHQVHASKVGHHPERRQFLAVGGVTETMSFSLTPVLYPGARRRRWGWASLGVGLPVLGAGITLLAVDGTSAPGKRCQGDNLDRVGACRYEHTTLAAGLAVSIGGVISATIGVVFLATHRSTGTRARVQARRDGLRVWF